METAKLSDEEIVAIIQTQVIKGKKLRSGHIVTQEQAWGHLISKYSPKLEKRAAIKWFNGNTYAAEAASEIWGKVFEKIDTLKCGIQPGSNSEEPTRGSFKSWLFKVFDRHCIDILRKHNPSKFASLPLGNVAEDEGAFDRIQQKVDKIYTAVSAEQEFINNNDQSDMNYQYLVQRHLPRSKAAFFLKYQIDPKKKNSKNKTKFFRIKNELILNMNNAWKEPGRSLETIMTKAQAYVLTARFVLGRREADICRELGIERVEFHTRLTGAIKALIQALQDETSD